MLEQNINIYEKIEKDVYFTRSNSFLLISWLSGEECREKCYTPILYSHLTLSRRWTLVELTMITRCVNTDQSTWFFVNFLKSLAHSSKGDSEIAKQRFLHQKSHQHLIQLIIQNMKMENYPDSHVDTPVRWILWNNPDAYDHNLLKSPVLWSSLYTLRIGSDGLLCFSASAKELACFLWKWSLHSTTSTEKKIMKWSGSWFQTNL